MPLPGLNLPKSAQENRLKNGVANVNEEKGDDEIIVCRFGDAVVGNDEDGREQQLAKSEQHDEPGKGIFILAQSRFCRQEIHASTQQGEKSDTRQGKEQGILEDGHE